MAAAAALGTILELVGKSGMLTDKNQAQGLGQVSQRMNPDIPGGDFSNPYAQAPGPAQAPQMQVGGTGADAALGYFQQGAANVPQAAPPPPRELPPQLSAMQRRQQMVQQ